MILKMKIIVSIATPKLLCYLLFCFLYVSSTNLPRAFNEPRDSLAYRSFSFSSLLSNVKLIFLVEMR